MEDIPPHSDFTYPREDIPWREVTQQIAPVDLNAAYYRALRGTLREGHPLAVTPEQARCALAVVARIRAQAAPPTQGGL
jgi:hypothetical protein